MSEIKLEYQADPNYYDVIVVGGGTAGSIAAIAAGREGKKVLILEREYALGGSSTLSQVIPRMTNKMTPEVCNSSVLHKVQTELEQEGCGYNQQWFNPVMTPVYLEKNANEYGVDIFYGANFIKAIVNDGKIDQLLFMTEEGLKAFSAKTYIDATGGAKVAISAGCSCESGDENGKNQAMSLRFAIGNVNIEELKSVAADFDIDPLFDEPWIEMASVWSYKNNRLTELFKKGVEDGVLEQRDGNYFQAIYCKFCGENVVWCNCPEAGFVRDALHGRSITEMILYSRQAAVRIHNFLKKYLKGFENSDIHSFASIPGIRESSRLVGEYVLSFDDYDHRAKFHDGIAQTAYPVDIHGGEEIETTPFKKEEYYEVPFRSLVPKDGVTNLLVAGRCISASFLAQSSMRIQPVVIATGEAAGIAAAMYDNFKNADGAKIREKMISYGGVFRD